MDQNIHKTTPQNHIKTTWFSSSSFTGKAPRKGNRAPLNQIKYSEERDEEKEMSGGHFASERGEEPRSGIQYCSSLSFTNFGARYMDHELMTMWLSVDPMADKYPNISPYAYCNWNPVKLMDPDGREAIDEDDWYKDKNGYVHWDANVHSQKDLKNGEEYLGKTVMMVAEGSDEVTYGDQYGHTHASVPLREVSISETLTDFERTMYNPLVQSIHQSAADFWGHPVTEAVVDATLFVVTGGTEAVAKGVGKAFLKLNAKRNISNIEKLVVEAQKRYPKKAGKTELHHIVPKYLGGDAKGSKVAIDGAYHQVITNEFRSAFPYGQRKKPSPEQLKSILKTVYSKYPIPTP